MAENTPDFAALEKRVTALESGNVTIQAAVKTFTTEAQVKTIAGETATATTKTVLASDEGKKIIEAEASRVVIAAMGGTGTTPVKPSPAGGVDTNASVENLKAQGKFEEAYALDKEAQAEFPDAKCYAAFMKNRSKVSIRTR